MQKKTATRAVKKSVAPVRERGLKFVSLAVYSAKIRRSREGAWIEITSLSALVKGTECRSREGAWIEIIC